MFDLKPADERSESAGRPWRIVEECYEDNPGKGNRAICSPLRAVALCGPLPADELDDLRDEFGRHDHDSLALCAQSSFVFRNLLVFRLVVVVLRQPADSILVPSSGIPLVFLLGHFFFPSDQLHPAYLAATPPSSYPTRRKANLSPVVLEEIAGIGYAGG